MIREHARALIKFIVAILIVLGLGLISGPLFKALLSEETQGKILIKALPFVLIFVSIVLTFIFLIVLLALQFSGNVPQRLYRPVEYIIIAGILLGIVGLFQPWKLFSYTYGFLVLLISTLAFIAWSHITPKSARASAAMPPLTRRDHMVGIVVGVIVWAIVAGVFITSTKPAVPYDFSQKVWEFKKPAEQAQITQEKDDEYKNAKIPVFAAISLLPGGIATCAAREFSAWQGRKRQPAAHDESKPRQNAGMPAG